MRQLLIESLLLAVAGGVLGIALGFAVTRGLLALVPSQGQPLLIAARTGGRVLAFTLALRASPGSSSGCCRRCAPAAPTPGPRSRTPAGSVAGTGGSLFLRKGLVIAQVALSFLLLAGAGLFVRSLQNLKATDTGVALDNLVAFEISPALGGYDDTRAVLFYRELLERLRAAPGVKSAALATVRAAGSEWDSSMSVEGHQAKDGEDMQAFMNAVSPGFFKTMNTAFLEGRDFRAGDAREDATVAIVNRRFAEHFFPGRSAVGKRLGFGGGPKTKLTIEVVGVVGDMLDEGPREGVHRQVFIPNWGKNSGVFYLRTLTPPASVHALVRNEVRRLDPGIPVST